MAEVTVANKDQLLSALKSSTKEEVTIRFSVSELDFHNTGELYLDSKCRGVTMIGPVTLRGTRFTFDGVRSPIELMYIRCRGSTENLEQGDNMDVLYARKCYSVTLSHCSFSGSVDEVVSLDYCDVVTIRSCIIGPPFHRPTVNDDGVTPIHLEGIDKSHGYGLRSSACSDLIITDTVFTDCNKRSPQCNSKYVKKNGVYQVTVDNCVVFNYGEQGFAYNNNEEKKGVTFNWFIMNNTFIPGPRTCKIKSSVHEAVEIDCEDTEEIRISLEGVESNRVVGYDRMLVLFDGKSKYVKNGRGSDSGVVSQAGCLPRDDVDNRVVSDITRALQSPHVYDNLDVDNYQAGWPSSGWTNDSSRVAFDKAFC